TNSSHYLTPPPPTDLYPLSLHDALPIFARRQHGLVTRAQARECGFSDDAVDWRMKNGLWQAAQRGVVRLPGAPVTLHQKILAPRSEEHTSELQSPDHLVCRLLLEKKNKK